MDASDVVDADYVVDSEYAYLYIIERSFILSLFATDKGIKYSSTVN